MIMTILVLAAIFGYFGAVGIFIALPLEDEPVRCPKCNSKQTKIVEYKKNYSYMGTWLHCRRCGQNTQIVVPENSKGEKQ